MIELIAICWLAFSGGWITCGLLKTKICPECEQKYFEDDDGTPHYERDGGPPR